jgi:predicted ester cyclase
VHGWKTLRQRHSKQRAADVFPRGGRNQKRVNALEVTAATGPNGPGLKTTNQLPMMDKKLDGTIPRHHSHRGMRWTILLLSCYISAQCALRATPRDLATYMNRDIYGIAELEAMTLERYAELTGDNYISDHVLQSSLQTEIIPAYTHFTDLVGKIKPETTPVQELHAVYRSAARLRLQGFRTILMAIETQDPDLVQQANRMLDQGRQLVSRWREQLADMSDQFGLVQQ